MVETGEDANSYKAPVRPVDRREGADILLLESLNAMISVANYRSISPPLISSAYGNGTHTIRQAGQSVEELGHKVRNDVILFAKATR